MTVSPATSVSPAGRHLRLPVLDHVEVGPRSWRLTLDAPGLARASAPGQFVHVLCAAQSAYDPLLRRPLSVHDADRKTGRVSLLYEVRGRGTALLAEKAPGDTLDLLGPLGQGFTLPESADARLLLVAGGIAVAPLYFLARRIADSVGCRRATFLIGARTKSMLLCVDEFSQLGAEVRVSTDDGNAGYHGFVTGLLSEHVGTADDADAPLVYACGPMPMLKAVAEITKSQRLKCEVSTEAKMACGVGACMSCAIKVRSGNSFKYVRACKEGPVFDADEVIW